MKQQGITIQFTFPANWDTAEFIDELFGAFEDMAGRDRAEKVNFRIMNGFGTTTRRNSNES